MGAAVGGCRQPCGLRSPNPPGRSRSIPYVTGSNLKTAGPAKGQWVRIPLLGQFVLTRKGNREQRGRQGTSANPAKRCLTPSMQRSSLRRSRVQPLRLCRWFGLVRTTPPHRDSPPSSSPAKRRGLRAGRRPQPSGLRSGPATRRRPRGPLPAAVDQHHARRSSVGHPVILASSR